MGKTAHRKRIKRIILLTAASTVIAVFLLTIVSIWGLMKRGERQLYDGVDGLMPDMSQAAGCVQNGSSIMYKGQLYEYDTSNINVLCMGVDARGEDEKVGQADMLALLVFNPEKKSVKCICINRDSIGPVVVYGVAGKPVTTAEIQIALAYSYGGTQAEGRELEKNTVSGLLYDIPINGSVSADIDGIGDMNAIAGGVTLKALEDVPRAGISEGETLTLTDEQAMYYVTERESASSEIGTNERRIARQKQYISTWCDSVQKILRRDLFDVLDMYDTMKEYIDTDISKESMLYLAKTFGTVGMNDDDIYVVPGKYEREDYYDRYLIDEEQLADMLIEIFYRKVE